MRKDNVVAIKNPEPVDELTQLLREGAQKLLCQAVQVELDQFLMEHRDSVDVQGRQQVVRNGYLPAREVLTGVGPVRVQVPKTRDRAGTGACFRSSLLPPYIKRSQSVDNVLPWLYLKGISTGDFGEALEALLGPDAAGLSAGAICRLKNRWTQEHEAWKRRDLSLRRYVYIWVDGIHFNIRGDQAKQCILVVIGVNERGEKEFLAIDDGYRESEQSWREVLLDLKHRGLIIPPKLAVGDGALGFWAALPKIYPETRPQRCWVHKTGNILNKLPKSVQPKAKAALQDIWMAPTRKAADAAFDHFVLMYQAKYPKAVECLVKDRESLLAFYDFPAEHWVHIRTTNPIESTFATVRLRTVKTRGCVSRATILALVFKLGQSAEKGWRKLRGFRQLAQVIEGIKFVDGVIPTESRCRTAA